MKCESCGMELEGLRFCKNCYNSQGEFVPTYRDDYPPYDKIFMKFDDAGGKFFLTFNIMALLFTSLWYVSKGMWVKALVIILTYLFVIFTIGVSYSLEANAALGIYTLVVGNYDYYRFIRGGKVQFLVGRKLSWW